MLASIGQHAGTMINAAAFIVVVFLVAFFGLKPMVAAIGKPAAPALAGPSFEEVQRSLPGPDAGGGAGTQPARSDCRHASGLDAARRPAPEDPPRPAGPAGPHGRPQ